MQGSEKALVTGGAGFIGSHLCTALLERGLSVVVLDDLSTGHRDNLAHLTGDIDLRVGDVRDASAVREATRGCRYVLHQAAMVSVPASVAAPDDCHDVNATGTLNVLEAARTEGVEAVTFAASAAAYGSRPELPKREDMAPDAVSPYAATKLLGEHYCSAWARGYGLSCVALRYFNIFGERQDPSGPYAGVISKFIDRLAAGQRPTVLGDGGQTRDFCYVGDVVRANLAALADPTVVVDGPTNIGTGRSTSLLDLLDTLNRIFGTELEPEFGPERAGDVRHSVADVTRARERLGWQAETTLEDGLRRLVTHVVGGG